METFLSELSLLMTNSFARVDGYHEEAVEQLKQLFSNMNPKVCETINEIDENDYEKENKFDSNKIKSPVLQTKQEKEDVKETEKNNSFSVRPRRTAAANACDLMKKQREFESATKLRRPSDFDLKKVKVEKQSIAPSNDLVKENELMPPPVQAKTTRTKRKCPASTKETTDSISTDEVENSPKPKPSKRTKTSKRTKAKKPIKKEEDLLNVSPDLFDEADIELIPTVHPTVYLSDTEGTENSRHSIEEKSINEPSEKDLKTLAATRKNVSHLESDKSVYEDAMSELNSNNNANATFVVPPAKNVEENSNATFTLPKPMEVDTSEAVSDCVSPIKGINSEIKKQQILFSPLDPVKKRIAAIEKLTNSSGQVPSSTRVTRLKTRAMSAASKKEEEKGRGVPSNIATGITSFITKPASAAKPTKIDLQKQREEDQRKKIAKEDEAKQKRDALFRAKVEEQRKRREEKLLRVQQQREEKERLRQERYEKQEREKEEEKKRLLAEREEASRKELLRKKAISEKRALETEERRKAEEAARLQRLLEQEEAKKQADAQRKKEQEEAEILHQRKMQEDEFRNKMKAQAKEKLGSAKKKTLSTPGSSYTDSKLKNKPTSKIAPYLKTNKLIIDFDSDSDSDHVPKVKAPWKVDSHFLRYQNAVPSLVKHNLYSGSSKLLVINLKEVFPKLNAERLGRNSSAIWKTPPRYSMLNYSITQS